MNKVSDIVEPCINDTVSKICEYGLDKPLVGLYGSGTRESFNSLGKKSDIDVFLVFDEPADRLFSCFKSIGGNFETENTSDSISLCYWREMNEKIRKPVSAFMCSYNALLKICVDYARLEISPLKVPWYRLSPRTRTNMIIQYNKEGFPSLFNADQHFNQKLGVFEMNMPVFHSSCGKIEVTLFSEILLTILWVNTAHPLLKKVELAIKHHMDRTYISSGDFNSYFDLAQATLAFRKLKVTEQNEFLRNVENRFSKWGLHELTMKYKKPLHRLSEQTVFSEGQFCCSG